MVLFDEIFLLYRDKINGIGEYNNPFTSRPWLNKSGAAASTGGSNRGLKGIVAGGLSGAIEVSITYPTEFVKTNMQLDEKGDRKQYTSNIDCVRKTVKKYGFFGLYRGMAILLYGSIPKFGVRFGSFEFYKEHMKQHPSGNLTPAGRLLCGLGAGVTEAVLVVTPLETIKVRFIHDRRLPEPRFKSFIHGISTIVKEHGLQGIYKGVTTTIVKQGTNQAIRFFIVETGKDTYKAVYSETTVPKPLVGLLGALAGAASVLANNPVDVIKTRMQGLESSNYKNSWDCVTKTWKQEGPKAFYKGTLARLTRVCLDVGITFMVYDSVMDLFNKVWP